VNLGVFLLRALTILGRGASALLAGDWHPDPDDVTTRGCFRRVIRAPNAVVSGGDREAAPKELIIFSWDDAVESVWLFILYSLFFILYSLFFILYSLFFIQSA
jgi:hypothetical protein